MANKRSWDSQHAGKRLDYLFRAYVRMMGGETWPTRHALLRKLVQECGEHYSWAETIHVGPNLERQEWAIFGFKEYEQKLKFEAGLPDVMAVEINLPPCEPLRLGGDPNRDLSDLARRMAHKPYRAQWR